MRVLLDLLLRFVSHGNELSALRTRGLDLMTFFSDGAECDISEATVQARFPNLVDDLRFR